MSEFDLIQKYFTWDNPPSDIAIAVGDDAAVLDVQTANNSSLQLIH